MKGDVKPAEYKPGHGGIGGPSHGGDKKIMTDILEPINWESIWRAMREYEAAIKTPGFKWGKMADFYTQISPDILVKYAKSGMPLNSIQGSFGSSEGKMTTMSLNLDKFPGGIKVPHLHYEDDTYLLSKEQWKAFSHEIIEGFRAKLAGAKTINYDQLLDLADTMKDIV